jgi:hypothetical protein
MREKDVWRDGDESAGYEVRIDRARRLLRFEFWGYWQLGLGISYRDTCIAAMKRLSPGGRWCVLANISRYPAQKPEVAKCHADTMVVAGPLGMARAANLVDNTLSQMQIRRLSQESGLPEFAFFQDENEAIAWLEAEHDGDKR